MPNTSIWANFEPYQVNGKVQQRKFLLGASTNFVICTLAPPFENFFLLPSPAKEKVAEGVGNWHTPNCKLRRTATFHPDIDRLPCFHFHGSSLEIVRDFVSSMRIWQSEEPGEQLKELNRYLNPVGLVLKIPRNLKFEHEELNSLTLNSKRQIAAVRAVRDVEIEHLQTELRLLRSCFNQELLQKPVLRFFEENFSDLSVVNDKKNKKFEVRRNNEDSRLSMNCADQRYVHASFLQRLSIAYPDCAAAIPPLGGYEYSSKAGRTSLLGADNLHINEFEPSETQTLMMQDVLQTPVSNQRSSVGMTPKRLPKPGEMLLSVHGSPLGVYKENNMEAIHESGNVECLLKFLLAHSDIGLGCPRNFGRQS